MGDYLYGEKLSTTFKQVVAIGGTADRAGIDATTQRHFGQIMVQVVKICSRLQRQLMLCNLLQPNAWNLMMMLYIYIHLQIASLTWWLMANWI